MEFYRLAIYNITKRKDTGYEDEKEIFSVRFQYPEIIPTAMAADIINIIDKYGESDGNNKEKVSGETVNEKETPNYSTPGTSG